MKNKTEVLFEIRVSYFVESNFISSITVTLYKEWVGARQIRGHDELLTYPLALKVIQMLYICNL